MNRLFLGALCVCFVMFSCKQKPEGEQAGSTDSESQEITEKEISKLDYVEFLLDDKTEALVTDWVEYNQLQEVIDNVKTGDLSFFYDNNEVIKTTLTELEKTMPDALNVPAIIARITAFKTKFLKLESLSNLGSISKPELLATVKELLVAFSNLNLQMNKEVEFDNQNIEKP